MRPLFVITSVIEMVSLPADFFRGEGHPTVLQYQSFQKSSVFDSSARYQQTLATIESIRKYVPHAYIVVVEASPYIRITIPGADQMYYTRYPMVISQCVKSVGEAMILHDFFTSTTFHDLMHSHKFGLIFKLSGRYTLNASFDLSKFDPSKITAKKIIRDPLCSVNPDQSSWITSLYAMNKEHIPILLRQCEIVQQRCSRKDSYCDIEQALFYGIAPELMVDIDVLGVEGYIAPSAEKVSY